MLTDSQTNNAQNREMIPISKINKVPNKNPDITKTHGMISGQDPIIKFMNVIVVIKELYVSLSFFI